MAVVGGMGDLETWHVVEAQAVGLRRWGFKVSDLQGKSVFLLSSKYIFK